MKPQFLKMNFTLFIIIVCSIVSQAQGIKLISSTDLMQWTQGQSNASLEIQSSKTGSKWGIHSNVAYQAGTNILSSFENQFTFFSFSSDLRIFPAGTYAICLSSKRPTSTFCNGKYEGCLQGFFGKKENMLAKILRGTYLSVGYFNEKTEHVFIPDPSLESPISNFPVKVQEEGVEVGIGYQVHVYSLTLEAGYHWLLGVPEELGHIKVFGDNLYTQTHPFSYRIRQNIQIKIGMNF